MPGSGFVRDGLVTLGVAAATVGNMSPSAAPNGNVDSPAETVTTSAVEGLAQDAGQFAEVAADTIRDRDAVAAEVEALPGDPPGEHRDAEPDQFGPEYMRDAEAFARDGIDGAAGTADSPDLVDVAPEAGGDIAPDGGGLGGLA